jgi:uncharacterized protein (TIGR02600 family)
MVLTCLVLVTALAIGLLSRVQADRAGSAAYRGGANSRNLSEYAVNLVMSQIASATTGANAGNAWASQPGAIRVFDNTGSLVNIYKLYSSPNMTGDITMISSDASAMANWTNNTALYTDLNSPVVSWSLATKVTNYPILDPGATNSSNAVQGFSIDNSVPNATSNQPAPMPVSWLYVLQDGTLVAPTAASTNSVTVTGATSSNPITGRIAFWTDDETCKVNINTAAGMPWDWTTNNPGGGPAPGLSPSTTTLFGSYWDTPVLGSIQDANLAFSQPWEGEYQRFPGHPATVSLSVVFTNLTTNDIMQIAPRLSYTSNGTSVGSQWGSMTNIASGSKIPNDAARLYADPDELLYSTNRSLTNSLTPSQINQGRFFITAVSRAPDVTLFNTPRLSMWPVSTAAANRTPYDNLIAFCGTLGANTNYSYYFQRQNAYSPSTDYNLSRNQSLVSYLTKMTTIPVPGFGGVAGANSGILGKYNAFTNKESDQIVTEIFDYIRCINLQDNYMKWNGSTNYYSTNGLVVPTAGNNNTWGFGRMPAVTKAGMLFWFNTNNTTTFIQSNPVSGGITPNTASNTAIIARLVLETFVPGHGYPQITNTAGYSNALTGLLNMRWGANTNTNTMVSIFTNDTASYTEFNAGSRWNQLLGGRRPITLDSSSVGGTDLGAYCTNTNNSYFTTKSFSWVLGTNDYITNTLTHTNIYKGTGSGTVTTGCTTGGMNVISYPGGSVNYANSNDVIVVTATPPTQTNINYFYFLGPTNSIQTLKSYYNGTLLQTIDNIPMGDPSGQIIPLRIPNRYTNTTFNGPTWLFNANGRCSETTQNTIGSNDVIVSSQIRSGDFRMIPYGGGNNCSGGITWATHPSNAADQLIATNSYRAHTFYSSAAIPYLGASINTNTYYYPASNTMVTITGISSNTWANGDMITNKLVGVSAYLTTNGDFDNGYGFYPDGPYIGFADEGLSSTNTSVKTQPYFAVSMDPVNTQTNGAFSPNRLVPSAGIMGSLPTGAPPGLGAGTDVGPGQPWQTLLFRPSALTASTHPGLGAGNQGSTPSTTKVADCLLLDLFNMPVVEPYAISEPLSTAGRINMNYQILPFTYIHRSTAVMAALHTEMITAISNTTDANRKSLVSNLTSSNRFPLNLDTNNGTLRGFEDRFATNGIFVSAAEICSIPLVPNQASATYAGMTNWWQSYNYTGDNTKERPYARIYPKLTTKSNVYTVHYMVQVLKQVSPRTSWTTWSDTKDKVLATYRGATTIERYVNPRDPISDYTKVSLPLQSSDPNALPYKFRIIGERRFNP